MDTHVLKFKVGLGRGDNNSTKLMALKLTLLLVTENGVSKIQILRILQWLSSGRGGT